MKEDKEISVVTVKVAHDILIDILSILTKERFRYVITEVIENRSLVTIEISVNNKLPRQIAAMKSINSNLELYEEYRFSQDEEFNWRN